MESLTSNDAQIPSRWRRPSNNSGRASFDDKANSAKFALISEGAQSSENSATKRYGLHLSSSHPASPEIQSGVFRGDKTAVNIRMQSSVETAKDLQVEKVALEEQKKALAEWEAHLQQKEDALALQEKAATLPQSSKSENEQARRLQESIGGRKDEHMWTEQLDEVRYPDSCMKQYIILAFACVMTLPVLRFTFYRLPLAAGCHCHL